MSLSSRSLYVISIGMMASGVALSNYATYLWTKKVLTTKYEAEFEQRLKFEIEETKEYYRKLNKKEEFSDPNKLAEPYAEESSEDGPYVITSDEFVKTFTEYEKITLTYFEEDDVLTDAGDKPLTDIDGLIGLRNLERFGNGSKDHNIVYVRNIELETDFEVMRTKGNYAKDVLGFVEHSEPRGKPRKFRRDYE